MTVRLEMRADQIWYVMTAESQFLNSVFLEYQLRTALVWKRFELQIWGWSHYLLLFELTSELINFVKFNSLVHSLCSMKYTVTFILLSLEINVMGILLHYSLVKNAGQR